MGLGMAGRGEKSGAGNLSVVWSGWGGEVVVRRLRLGGTMEWGGNLQEGEW